jgi:hypothetical protein
MPEFSTVSLMRETPEAMRRFVDYYERAGASEILIYHDGPAPDVQLGSCAVLIECDEAFWNARGGRPEALESRQGAVFLIGLERCRTPWLLVVDADEFVFGDMTIAELLELVPDDVDAVRLPTAEAVWGPGDPFGVPFASTYFRTAWPPGKVSRLMCRLIFGRISGQMRSGLTGHTGGKEFIRTGRGIDEIGNHRAYRGGREVTVDARRIDRRLEAMFLGHFDGIGLEHWTRKWYMRAEKETGSVRMREARSAQMKLILRTTREGDAAMRALFARYYGLTPVQYRTLSAMGRVFRRDIFAAAGEPPSGDPAPAQASPTTS